MPGSGPTFRIDPIDPSEVGPRFAALMERLEPVLAPDDVATIRRQMAAGDTAAAYDRLDAITNDGTVSVDTATLIEIVLLGQAIRSG